MERKRKEVDKGKSKSHLASSSGSIHSQAPKAPMKMEQDGSPTTKAKAALHYDNIDEIMKKARFGEGLTKKMEKDGSSSKERGGSHSFMEMIEKARLREATRAYAKMQKDRSSTSKARASSHSLEIKEKAKLGEARKASVKMEKDGSSASKARAASQSLFELMGKPKLGEPSKILCLLCMKSMESEETYRNSSCSHSYCIKCISMYVPLRIVLNKGTSSMFRCPAYKCKAILELSPGIVPGPVFQRWNAAKYEALHIESKKNQSPFEDCNKGGVSRESEYPWNSHKDQLRVLGESGKKVGEPSQGRFRFYGMCEICCERKESTGMFRNEGCRHSVCTDCISKHVEVKIESNSGMILCPGMDCRGVLDPERCRGFLPKTVVERWEKAIIETLILDSEKFYCPFKDCSAMLLNDNAEAVMMMRESECPHCRRLFCVQCRVPWHSGMECREVQRLNADERGREDMLLKKLAEEKKWKRCPQCKFYVEKIEGCVHLTCRCGFEFCYRCGGKWSVNHGTCQLRR
ncbi:putative E3 ubiquitin-protein ligase RNF217 [Vitis vinifera]|uniref:RBR-type E3 ubiquitin transferase n=1 Tax=Vitis vinifera TaxID=29760 RepID=A0A438EMX2_VITVI|nr:putative E3 ubiquitin-protein ligase RNF217 [Vitis vinifera]